MATPEEVELILLEANHEELHDICANNPDYVNYCTPELWRMKIEHDFPSWIYLANAGTTEYTPNYKEFYLELYSLYHVTKGTEKFQDINTVCLPRAIFRNSQDLIEHFRRVDPDPRIDQYYLGKYASPTLQHDFMQTQPSREFLLGLTSSDRGIVRVVPENNGDISIHFSSPNAILTLPPNQLAVGAGESCDPLILRYTSSSKNDKDTRMRTSIGISLTGDLNTYYKYSGNNFNNLLKTYPKLPPILLNFLILEIDTERPKDEQGLVQLGVNNPYRRAYTDILRRLDLANDPDPNYMLDNDTAFNECLTGNLNIFIPNNIFENFLPTRARTTISILEIYRTANDRNLTISDEFVAVPQRDKLLMANLLIQSKEQITLARYYLTYDILSYTEILSIVGLRVTNTKDSFFIRWLKDLKLPTRGSIIVNKPSDTTGVLTEATFLYDDIPYFVYYRNELRPEDLTKTVRRVFGVANQELRVEVNGQPFYGDILPEADFYELKVGRLDFGAFIYTYLGVTKEGVLSRSSMPLDELARRLEPASTSGYLYRVDEVSGEITTVFPGMIITFWPKLGDASAASSWNIMKAIKGNSSLEKNTFIVFRAREHKKEVKVEPEKPKTVGRFKRLIIKEKEPEPYRPKPLELVSEWPDYNLYTARFLECKGSYCIVEVHERAKFVIHREDIIGQY